MGVEEIETTKNKYACFLKEYLHALQHTSEKNIELVELSNELTRYEDIILDNKIIL